MERKQTKLYRLIDLKTGRVYDFDQAISLANMLFVLSLWKDDAAMYKAGRRFVGPWIADVEGLARALEAF